MIALMSLGNRPGSRIQLDEASRKMISSLAFAKEITSLWPGMRPVRAVGFDKNTGQNWGVPWHQDRVVCVKSRVDLPGYKNWSKKSETWHCEPPVDVLNAMLFVRIHLDPNTHENGAMEIARGSHVEGLVRSADADHIAQRYPHEVTEAAAGDVLVMPMLTLHRSRVSTQPSSRRTIRVDFASSGLDERLTWAN